MYSRQCLDNLVFGQFYEEKHMHSKIMLEKLMMDWERRPNIKKKLLFFNCLK
jgi:hypothetical protein